MNLADEYYYYASKENRTVAGRKIQTLVSGNEDDYFTEPETQFTKDKVADYKKYASVQEPFLLKDARFQAWVIYPGATFRGTTIYLEGGIVNPDGTPEVYPDSNNPNPQSPWYDMRYSEILLTYAEAVVESGKGDKNLAKQCLNEIRHRAGFTDDIDLTLENILHEWKVEFPFENKWSNVLYRRRGFYNPNKTDNQEEGNLGVKLTLIPMVDLSGSTAQYIFLRALPVTATAKYWSWSGVLSYTGTYYSGIPNYENNHIETNNK